MFNLNGLQPAAVTNISLCFGLTITILVYSFAGASARLDPTHSSDRSIEQSRSRTFRFYIKYRHFRGKHQPVRFALLGFNMYCKYRSRAFMSVGMGPSVV